MPTIRLEQAAKLYKGNGRQMAAVLDVDLTVEQGEFVFFVGSRGAGKSTLLNLISGELEPDRGAVFFDQQNLAKMNRWQRRRLLAGVSKVSQESQLIRTETVFNNLCSMNRMTVLRNRLIYEPLIRKALGLVGMSGSEERYPLEFSISECRRIELAKAILHSPQVLILDEITDRMEDDAIWDILQLLSELNRHGTTILMSTHAGRFVNIMRRRVVTLVDGKVAGDVRRGRFGDIV